MKKVLVFVLVLAFLVPAGRALAETPLSPVLLSHTITGYTQGADSVTLDMLLHVENPGPEPVYNLTLEFVPLTLFMQEELFLNIGSVDAYGVLDVPFSIVTPMLLSQEEIEEHPFFWTGEATDAGNAFLMFPADSRVMGGGI